MFNFIVTSNSSFILSGIILLLLWALLFLIVHTLNKKGKTKNQYLWFEEKSKFFLVMIGTPMFAQVVSYVIDIKLFSCILLAALIEVIIIAFSFFNVRNIESSIILKIKKEKWYVFRRIDDRYLLCGNESNINTSTKTKLLLIDYVIEKDLCFEQDIIGGK